METMMNYKLALLFLAFCLALPSSSSSVLAEPTDDALDQGIPICGHLAPSTTNSFMAEIGPEVATASFILNWRTTDSQMQLALISPSGELMTLGQGIAHDRSKTFESFTVTSPEAGTWRAEIKSGAMPREGTDYCLIVQFEKVNDIDIDIDKARFNGLFSNYASKNSEGAVDLITIAVGISAKASGNYSLKGSIYDMHSKKEFFISNSGHLKFGSKTMKLHLVNPTSPGPYILRGLVLYDDAGDKIDEYAGNYTTRSYAKETLENQSARLSGRYLDYGTDSNKDGLYDFLTVDAGIDVFEEGNYSLMGSLYDASGKEIVWTTGYGRFQPGYHVMHMDFDGKTLELHKANGPYRFANQTLFLGDSDVQLLSLQDTGRDAYVTGPYNYTQFVDPVWPERILAGSGSGEILLTILVRSILPVYHDRFSLDIVGANMPPISSNWTVKGSKNGYSYDLPGVHMPAKPNNFTVRARGVKDLNVGVRKDLVKNGINTTRSWVSAQSSAGRDGTASIDSDLISPGRYHFKVFGDAADNVTQVELEMRIVKKLVIKGDFRLDLNSSGFPSGNYSINARALNGSLGLTDIGLQDSG
jgi:hypothetical protein